MSLDPPDDELLAAFTRYSQENGGAGLPTNDQIARLNIEFKLNIKRTKFFELQKRLMAPSVRKNAHLMSETEAVQTVIDLKANDIRGLWGVAATKQRLANRGVFIARNKLRTILHDHFDMEFDNRIVGKKGDKTPRTPLRALGPWHQEHSDGHEKLAEQGLNIGKDISLPIYSSKDQFGSWVHDLIVMPNIRNQVAMVHYYLDLIEARDYKISLQLVTDLGSEVGQMHEVHAALRAEAAPEFTVEEYPPSKKILSTRNTPIESFWRWQRNGEGHSMKEAILTGAAQGYFSPQDELHRNTFYWVWVPLVQQRLDEYRAYWNNHKLTGNHKKENPYGSSPANMFLNPKSVSPIARDCSIRVNPDSVQRFREAYGGQEARENAYRFYSIEFQALADAAYIDLGRPNISLANAWTVFREIVKRLE